MDFGFVFIVDRRTDGRSAERDAYDDHDDDHACGFDSSDDDTDRRSTIIDARCEDDGAKIDDFIQLWKKTTMRKDDDDDRVRIVERRDGGPERRPRNVLG